MSDPASVDVFLGIAGLSEAETIAVLRAVPVDRTLMATPTQPAIGGRRHEVHVSDLSIVSAGHVLGKLKDHMDAVAAGSTPNARAFLGEPPCGKPGCPCGSSAEHREDGTQP